MRATRKTAPHAVSQLEPCRRTRRASQHCLPRSCKLPQTTESNPQRRNLRRGGGTFFRRGRRESNLYCAPGWANDGNVARNCAASLARCACYRRVEHKEGGMHRGGGSVSRKTGAIPGRPSHGGERNFRCRGSRRGVISRLQIRLDLLIQRGK